MAKVTEKVYRVEVDVFNGTTLEKDFTLSISQSSSILEITEIYKKRVAESRHEEMPLVVMLIEYCGNDDYIIEQFENNSYLKGGFDEVPYFENGEFSERGLEKAKELLLEDEEYRKFMVEEWYKNESGYMERNNTLETATFLEFFDAHGAMYHMTIELLNNSK